MPRPLFRVTLARDVPIRDGGTVDLNDLSIGHVDYDYQVDGRPAVLFMPRGPPGPPGPHPVADYYMQVGHGTWWPRVKIRYALIVTPFANPPRGDVSAALHLNKPINGYAYGATSRARQPRSPGHYFLEAETVFQAQPGNGYYLVVNGVGSVLAGSYVEITWLD